MFALADGAEVHVLGLTRPSLDFAAALGVHGAWTEADLPGLPFDAVIDASNAADLPARALGLVEPGKRVVYVGVAGHPSIVDTRSLVLKDVTAVGILGASAGLPATIERYADGSVDPRRWSRSRLGWRTWGRCWTAGAPPARAQGRRFSSIREPEFEPRERGQGQQPCQAYLAMRPRWSEVLHCLR